MCYILKHLKDKKLWSVHVYYMLWRHSHSQTAQKNSASLRSSIHSSRIRMTSYPCNKYEQITPSYLLSVNWLSVLNFGIQYAGKCWSWRKLFVYALQNSSSTALRIFAIAGTLEFVQRITQQWNVLLLARHSRKWLRSKQNLNKLNVN